jgi:hypothetical protein
MTPEEIKKGVVGLPMWSETYDETGSSFMEIETVPI